MRGSTWVPGDKIVNCLTGRKGVVKQVFCGSFVRVTLTDGRRIVDEALDFWDLEIPELTFGGEK